jgi:hypothetical protein
MRYQDEILIPPLEVLLTAETYCNEVVSGGLPFEQLFVNYLGGFKRSYRNDIEKAEYKYSDLLKQFVIQVDINRDGIYDRLPEGLFHQSKGNSRTLTTREMVEEYRRYREEERNARKFFQPIEQELFRFATDLRKEELDLSFAMLNGRLKDELNKFWNIPADLPKECTATLVKIMPWIYRIKGNLESTSKALALILGKPVKAQETETDQMYVGENDLVPLGQCLLGVDSVTGSSFSEPSLCWKFKIGELTEKEIELYPSNRKYGKLLSYFEEVFIPLTIDVAFEYEFVENNEENLDSVLGYSFSI